MILYHGSYLEIDKPDVCHSRENVDFGKGFYLTPLYEQAEKWSLKFKRKGQKAVVNIYELDETIFESYKCIEFDTYSEQWLDFILNCRSGADTSDLVVVTGGVANDKVFNTIELYFEGLINKAEAIKRLRYEKPNLQIAIRNQEAINDYLTFKGSKTV